MNEKRMTWTEIKRRYPDQWVSLGNVDFEENGEVKSAIVIASGEDLKCVTEKSKGKRFISHKFEFTGDIKNFLGFAKWNLGNAKFE